MILGHGKRLARACAALGVLLASASPAPACQEVLSYLGGRAAFRDGFGKGVIELVELLSGIYTPEGNPWPQGQEKLAAAFEAWMDLYVRYYQDPPPKIARHLPQWRERMDSVAAPLRRVKAYHKAGAHEDAHRQLEILQRIFGSFGGAAPVVEAGGVGPLRHALASLAEIPGEDQEARRERSARWRIASEYFDRWKQACGSPCTDAAAVTRFGEVLETLRLAIAGEAPTPGAPVPDRAETLGTVRSLVDELQALRLPAGSSAAPAPASADQQEVGS